MRRHIEDLVVVRHLHDGDAVGDVAVRPELQRRFGVHEVGDRREVRELGVEPRGDARDVIAEQLGHVLDRMHQRGRAQEAGEATGGHVLIERTRDAVRGVDVPPRGTFEPGAGPELELAARRLEREGDAGAQASIGERVEFDAGLEGFVAEAQLHRRRLEQNTTRRLQHGEHLGGIFSPHLGGGGLSSVDVSRERAEERPVVVRDGVERGERVDDRNGVSGPGDHRRHGERGGAYDDAVLELVRAGEGVGRQPGVDGSAGLATVAAQLARREDVELLSGATTATTSA